MSCVSCFYRKLKFLFDSRPFCNFDSAYSLFCRKKPVTILLSNVIDVIYILIQSVHLELMQIRRLKSEEFASCKTCKTYRSSLYSEKTNMYPKLIPATPIKFEHLYSPGFVILSASDSLTCFIKNPLLFY